MCRLNRALERRCHTKEKSHACISSVLRPLVLAVVCLLLATRVAEANPRQRLVPPTVVYSTPAPVYTPGVRVAPSVYVYPQVITTPRYYAVCPSYSFGYPPYQRRVPEHPRLILLPVFAAGHQLQLHQPELLLLALGPLILPARAGCSLAGAQRSVHLFRSQGHGRYTDSWPM